MATVDSRPDSGDPGVPLHDLDELAPPVPDAVDLVLEAAKMMSVYAAQRLARIDAMRREQLAEAARHGSGVVDVVERSIRLELAAAMRITEFAAGRLIAHAEALVRRYPQAWRSLAGGRITEKHAEVFVDLVDQVRPELRDEVMERAVALAEAEPVGRFRRALSELITRVEAATLEERYARAVAGRRISVEPGVNGMGTLLLHHPEVELRAIHGRVTAMAKRIAAGSDETRTLDQIRADVVADLLIDGTTAHLPATASGIRAQVVVTVPALSLLDVAGAGAGQGESGEDPDVRTAAARPAPPVGGNDAAGPHGASPRLDVAPVAAGECADPGVVAPVLPGFAPVVADLPVVEGLGPIPLSKARELCAGDTEWMRVLTHPETGMVLSVGRESYRPPAALRRLVRWRADRCMAPGCGMPASRCEIDHQVRWADDGETCLDNNLPFCKGHHLVKDNTDWVVRQIAGSGGAVEWISPTGRRYVVKPARRVPTFTPSSYDRGTAAGLGAEAPF